MLFSPLYLKKQPKNKKTLDNKNEYVSGLCEVVWFVYTVKTMKNIILKYILVEYC